MRSRSRLSSGCFGARSDHMRSEGFLGAGFKMMAQVNQSYLARAPFTNQADEAAARLLLNRHPRHGRNTHARRDHGEDGGELTAFKNDVWFHTRLAAGVDYAIAEAMTFFEKQEGVVLKIRHAQRIPGGERMRLRKHGEEMVVK